MVSERTLRLKRVGFAAAAAAAGCSALSQDKLSVVTTLIGQDFVFNLVVRHNENGCVASAGLCKHRRCGCSDQSVTAKRPGTDFIMLLTPLGGKTPLRRSLHALMNQQCTR